MANACQSLFPSLGLDRDDLTHAVITASKQWGYGVFSWHNRESHAVHNAAVTGGYVVPLQRDGDGRVITPTEAHNAIFGGAAGN